MGKVLEDTELENRWIAALESGEYSQARWLLRDGVAFCCLGVLCDIQRNELGGTWDPGGIFSIKTKVYPPGSLDVPNGPTERVAKLLTALNDDGETFKEIAQRIREGNLEGRENV